MQTVVVGQSGSGKTTLLHNIASQDIRQDGYGRHLPVIIFDGKGDQEFLNDLLPEIAAAGRLHQLRVLDPFRPEISGALIRSITKEAQPGTCKRFLRFLSAAAGLLPRTPGGVFE